MADTDRNSLANITLSKYCTGQLKIFIYKLLQAAVSNFVIEFFLDALIE